MTNRDMVKDVGAHPIQAPNIPPLPPMPAPEGRAGPTTREEPTDSPQPNASVKREEPAEGEHGLSTER